MLLAILQRWLRAARVSRQGIPFEEFEQIIAKLWHAFIAIPAGNGLLSPCNWVMRSKPSVVYLHQNKALYDAVSNTRTLLRESTTRPTRCKELIVGWPDFIGVADALSHGIGGIVVGKNSSCIPTVFRFKWPDAIKTDLLTFENPNGKLTNSDLEMAGLLLLWLVMEAVCPDMEEWRVALFSHNSPTISWVEHLASRSSRVAAQLIRALVLRLKVRWACPLTPVHIPGNENAMTDIPSRSFGSEPQWHCTSDIQLLTLFNFRFPLPQQNSWTVFRLNKKIST